MKQDEIHRAIEAVWRIEAPQLIAGLARRVRDVGLAEELAQEALLAALEQWPGAPGGIPANPAAWLMATAKRRFVDQVRHLKMAARKHEDLGRERRALENEAPDLDAPLDDDFGDDLLRLMFTACHPVLPMDARVALTLRLLAGLSTEEIARAFLTSPATIGQRIVRAKKTLAESGVPFEVPRGTELAERMGSVLEVIYLLFNEGYAATAGEDWLRPALCEEALRLGRVLVERLGAGKMPPELAAEAVGLVALMEIQASRSRARVGPGGVPILLLEQNRALWDQLLIGRGLAGLERARRLAGGQAGPYVLQAAIAACHARAKTAAETDWRQIAALYGELAERLPSPVVELNRAVALGMAEGPAAGYAIVEALEHAGELAQYHLLPSVKGDLLEKMGRRAEAREAFLRAAELTQNERERRLLLERAERCLGEG